MPVPVAIPLSQLLGTATTGAALGKPTEETTPTEPTIPFSDVLARQFFGPSSSILQRTIDTPSGKVFAPDEPTPAKPDILATYPQSKDQPWIMSSPMPAGEPKGIMGLPIPETQDKLKGFQTPILPNFNVLNKKLNELPENKVDKFLEKQDFLYDNDYEIFLRDDQKKLKQGIIPENKKYTSNDLIERYGKYEPIHKYWEEEWAGGIGDLGSRLAGEIMRSGGMQQTESGLTAPSYYEDYKFKLQDLARKELGKDFIGYRLMSKAEMDDLLNEGNAAFDVKSYSLKKKSALGFKHFTNKAFIDMETGEPRADLVLAEAPLDVEGLVMRGNSNESEIVYDNQFVNPEQMNFYDLNGKLIKGAQSGFLTEDKKEKKLKEYVAENKSSFKTQDYLDEKIIDELLKLKGGKQKFEESRNENITMPASTKNKMEIILQQKLFDKYKLNVYPEGESPDTVSEERKKQLLNTYNKNLEAISYITSAAYDAISGPNKNTVFVVDNEGIPIAGAKIGKGDLFGNASKEALAIKEIGSINSNATNDLLKEVNARALSDGKKYIVAEDITSQEAIDAFKAKGFESASLKKYKQFEGKLVFRPGGGKKVKQKNYVKEVEGYEENTSNPVGSLIDKPLSNE